MGMLRQIIQSPNYGEIQLLRFKLHVIGSVSAPVILRYKVDAS